MRSLKKVLVNPTLDPAFLRQSVREFVHVDEFVPERVPQSLDEDVLIHRPLSSIETLPPEDVDPPSTLCIRD